MTIRFFDTLRGKKVDFVPIQENKVKIYNCGPTVYNYVHIGNARNFVGFDVIRRYFEYRGYEVTFVQNLTDIDDKIIRRANEEKRSCKEVSEEYTAAYFSNADALNIKRATVHPKATEHIPEMIALVSDLIEKGYAYEVEGDVYFEVPKFAEYGKLSKKNLEDLMGGARIEVDGRKKNPQDFALWKKKKEGEPFWNSPWGEGRPGWHLECSVMSMKYLGKNFDIHTGGSDLVFPHHENEIAQSECANGCQYANYFMHNGFIKIDGEKMSKSLGNFLMVEDALKEVSPEIIRYFLISAHYRGPMEFTSKQLDDAGKSVRKLHEFRKNLQEWSEKEIQDLDDEGKDTLNFVEDLFIRFQQVMDDDFNTPRAIALMFELINKFKGIQNRKWVSVVSRKALEFLEVIEEVLGLFFDLSILEETKDNSSEMTDSLMNIIMDLRNDARKNKNFSQADFIRDRLKEIGIEIKDSKEGTSYVFI